MCDTVARYVSVHTTIGRTALARHSEVSQPGTLRFGYSAVRFRSFSLVVSLDDYMHMHAAPITLYMRLDHFYMYYNIYNHEEFVYSL